MKLTRRALVFGAGAVTAARNRSCARAGIVEIRFATLQPASNSRLETTDSITLASTRIFSAFSAQKSHVKSQNRLNRMLASENHGNLS